MQHRLYVTHSALVPARIATASNPNRHLRYDRGLSYPMRSATGMQRGGAGAARPDAGFREQRRSRHAGYDGKVLTATIYPGHPAYPPVSEVVDGKADGRD